jgi:ABC-type amino acid transport substrate-binding protein
MRNWIGLFLVAGCLSVTAEVPRTIRLTMMENSALATDGPVKMLTQAYGRMGYGVEFTPLPFARSLAAADHGEFDGEVGRLAQVEKTATHLIRVPVAVGQVEYVPYVLMGSTARLPHWQAIRQSGLRVGARLGARLTEASVDRAQLTSVSSYESLLHMLLKGRIDVVIAPKGQLELLYPTTPDVVKDGVPAVKQLGVVATEPLYHYLHERNSALVAPLTSALRDLRTGRQ